MGWTAEHSRIYEAQSFTTHHELHESPLLADDALIALIDSYPRNRVQVFTMGTDPCDRTEWAPVDTQGASGAAIWHAIQRARVWVKLMRLDQHHPELGKLVSDSYEQIARRGGPRCEWTRPLMLISSPGAQVYYHADPNPTMLWQIRGVKRVWIYPANDHHLIAPELLEQIFMGEVDEEAPYSPEFDRLASVYDLQPGELLSWPMNAPHRVVNRESVNVSISVPYGLDSTDQRAQLYNANLMMRRILKLQPSTRETGLMAATKRIGYRAARKLGVENKIKRPRPPYFASLRVDGNAPNGLAAIAGSPVRTPF